MVEFIFLTDIPRMKEILKKRGIEIIGSYIENDLEHIIIDDIEKNKVDMFMKDLKEKNK